MGGGPLPLALVSSLVSFWLFSGDDDTSAQWAHNASASIWRPDGRRPWLEPRWRAEQLDTGPEGYVFHLPAFLSEDEVAHVRALAQLHAG